LKRLGFEKGFQRGVRDRSTEKERKREREMCASPYSRDDLIEYGVHGYVQSILGEAVIGKRSPQRVAYTRGCTLHNRPARSAVTWLSDVPIAVVGI